MTKRTFQILDEMNVADENNKTITCIVCPDHIRSQTHPMGIEVAMGVPAERGKGSGGWKAIMGIPDGANKMLGIGQGW